MVYIPTMLAQTSSLTAAQLFLSYRGKTSGLWAGLALGSLQMEGIPAASGSLIVCLEGQGT